MIDITKEDIEKELGYEINSFNLQPVYNKYAQCIGLNINVEPKKVMEYINIDIKIEKSDKKF